MSNPIEYATTTAGVPDAIRWEREGAGPTLTATVTLPPPSVWWDAFGLTLAIAFLSILLLAAGAFLYAVLTQFGPGPWFSIALGAGALLALGSLQVRAVRLLLAAPRMARVPTVICASPAGLLITTARTGAVRQYHIPAEQIAAIGTGEGPTTITLKRTVRIWIELFDGLEMFQFLTRARRVRTPGGDVCRSAVATARRRLGAGAVGGMDTDLAAMQRCRRGNHPARRQVDAVSAVRRRIRSDVGTRTPHRLKRFSGWYGFRARRLYDGG